jgi:predicted nuclease with TOPRIM domain
MARRRGKYFDVAAYMAKSRKEKAKLIEATVTKRKKVDALRKKLDHLEQIIKFFVINI